MRLPLANYCHGLEFVLQATMISIIEGDVRRSVEGEGNEFFFGPARLAEILPGNSLLKTKYDEINEHS